jgi:hypothetical protein
MSANSTYGYGDARITTLYSYRDEFRRAEEFHEQLIREEREELHLTWLPPRKQRTARPAHIKPRFMRIFRGRLFPIGG